MVEGRAGGKTCLRPTKFLSVSVLATLVSVPGLGVGVLTGGRVCKDGNRRWVSSRIRVASFVSILERTRTTWNRTIMILLLIRHIAQLKGWWERLMHCKNKNMCIYTHETKQPFYDFYKQSNLCLGLWPWTFLNCIEIELNLFRCWTWTFLDVIKTWIFFYFKNILTCTKKK